MAWMNEYQVMRCLSAGSLCVAPTFVVMSALAQLEFLWGVHTGVET